jgi:hypothetical protein
MGDGCVITGVNHSVADCGITRTLDKGIDFEFDLRGDSSPLLLGGREIEYTLDVSGFFGFVFPPGKFMPV